MKHIVYSISAFVCTAMLLLQPNTATAQHTNSLYFLEKTPFHTKWNPAMAPSRSGIGGPFSNFGMSFRSDLALSDIFYPTNGELLNVLHPDLPQADKDAFLAKLTDGANFGMDMGMDLFNIGLKFGKMYLTVGSTMKNDFGMGLPKDFFGLFMNGPASNGNLDLSSFNMNAMSYIKSGVGLSLKLSDKLSIGATANYLMGLSDIKLGFDQFTVNTSNTSWQVNTKGNLRVVTPEFVKLQYDSEGYLDFKNSDQMIDNTYFDNFGDKLKNDFTGTLPTAGTGLSFDFGLTFKPLSFLTISAAVLDMGSISWKEDCINQAKSNGSFTFNGADFSNEGSDMSEALVDLMHLQKVQSPEAYKTKLTTKLNIGAEVGLPGNKLSLGVLSQTGITQNGKYQDFMFSANLKPASLIQTALTYSLLHGEMSALGAAVNLKLLFINLYLSADYIPLKVTPQMMPINNSYFNFETGFNLMF